MVATWLGREAGYRGILIGSLVLPPLAGFQSALLGANLSVGSQNKKDLNFFYVSVI